MRRALLLGLVCLGSGCAFLNRDNLLLFDAFETHLVPDMQTSTGAHIATAPLTYPCGLVLIVLDAFITHPVLVADDSWHDTLDALWDDFEWDQHYVTEVTVLPLRALATPIVLSFIFLGRSTFDIDPHTGPGPPGEGPVEPPASSFQQGEAQVQEAVVAGDFAAGLELVKVLRTQDRAEVERRAAWGVVCAAGLADTTAFVDWLTEAGALDAMPEPGRALVAGFLRVAPIGPRLLVARRIRRFGLVRELVTDPDPVVRYVALSGLSRSSLVPVELHEGLARDPSPAVRWVWERLQAR